MNAPISTPIHSNHGGLPKVSVVIPSYNAAECLERAVHSVLIQSFQDFEILIIDDGSTDATVTIAQSLCALDARIKLLCQPTNQGPSAARNLGLRTATGTWIAVLDADDAMRPHRLERLLETAIRNDADIVADNLTPYDHGAERLLEPAFLWPAEHQLTLDLLLERDVYMHGNPLGWIKPMWKRQFLVDHGLEYPVQYRHAEDFYLLAAALLERADFWLRPDADYVYTLRQGPISGKKSPFSASQPNLPNIAASCQDLVQRYSHRLSAGQKHKFSQRVSRFMRGGAFLEIRNLLAQHHLLAAGKKAIANPGALVLYAQVKSASVARRLGLARP